MSKLELERMVGTQGKADYAKVATVDCIAIGVKPLLSVMGSKEFDGGITRLMIIGALRVRAAAKDDSTVVDVGKCISQVAPMLGWSKRSNERASCVLGESTVTTEGWDSREELMEDGPIVPTWLKIITKMQAEDDTETTLTIEQATEFFKGFIEGKVDQMFITAKENNVKIIPDSKKVSNGDNVVSMAEKKAAKAKAKQVPTTKKKKPTLTLDKSIVAVKKKAPAKKKVVAKKKVAKKKVPLKKGDE